MRVPIIAGNWKMNKTAAEAAAFVRELAPKLAPFTGIERVVCPPFIALPTTAEALAHSEIKVGAQNVSEHEKGAYTSQISAAMLEGLAEYVIIGHSECREYLGETDDVINRKIKAALAHGLKPIFAMGENLTVNEAGETLAFVGGQVRAGLEGITAEQMQSIVLAYEPIWAIGTGKSANAQFANEITGGIRGVIESLYSATIADDIRIQYGGSVKPANMAEYMSQEHIDGALVGGASLIVDDFVSLVQAAQETKGA
ncbi:MAG: triose-phosphate isomerase [Anaerolineae bacterium]|nr:triose-phosphate isomerase [Anaerolineae bacterium]